MNETKKSFYVLASFVVLSIVMTYPCARDMVHKIDLGDPMLNAFIMAANYKAMTTVQWQLFDTNMFYPYQKTLTFSDPLISSVVLLFPLFATVQNYILMYNLVVLLGFILSGFFMYLLVYYLVRDTLAAFFSGIVYAFCHLALSHIYWVQLSGHWIPLAFLFLLKTCSAPSYRHSLPFAGAFLMQVYTGLYNAVYLAIGIFLFVLYSLRNIKSHREHMFLKHISIALLAVGIFSLPLYRAYSSVHRELGFQRTIEQNEAGSARPADYLAPFYCTRPYQVMFTHFKNPNMWWEKSLFPGFVTMLLGILGIYQVFLAKNRQELGSLKESALFFLLLGSVFFIISLGPLNKVTPIPDLFLFFYRYFPGLSGMKVPARAAIMVMLCLAVLAGMGLLAMKRLLARTGLTEKGVQSICLVFTVFALVEYWSVPVNMTPNSAYERESRLPSVYKWLGDSKENFAIIELPTSDPFEETRRMYYSTQHGKKLVNGYSGHPSPLLCRLQEMGVNALSREALAILKEINVRYLIVHLDQYGEAEAVKLMDRCCNDGFVKESGRFGDTVVLEFIAKEP